MAGSDDRPPSRSNLLAALVVGILVVMLVPMPTVVLDLLLTVNISLGLLILVSVMNAGKPADFSSFPSILLFTALFRLALNVASTRLILLEGEAGMIIKSFGHFVVGGNVVVGVVVFVILVVIQFVVITRGQNRISEVTARFTLDAMPGKQMSIDADLSSGLISNEEAKQRRKELQDEAQFYGAMDGAGKFVRGDAIAGMIITAINVIGGFLIGKLYYGLPAGEAISKYAILTIGDGLVAQIPSLLISTAAGILVTKSASSVGLQAEVGEQMFGKSPALRVVGGILAGLAFMPGMPTLPVLGVALLLFTRGRSVDERDAVEVEPEPEKHGDEEDQTPIEELLGVDRLGIEIGYRLISLVDKGRHGSLLDHIRAVRRQFATNVGLIIPPIRVKDNIQLEPNHYRILLNGQPLGSGELRAGHYLAMDPGGDAGPISGIDTVEPAFGLQAKWISESEKDRAEVLGYTVIDAPSVLVTHLTELLKKHAYELLSRDDTKSLIDNLKATAPAVVEELLPSKMTIGEVQGVLGRLLREQVPIRNLQQILEALADSSLDTKDITQLTERVRTRIARTVLEPYLSAEGHLHVAVIEPTLERSLADAVAGTDSLTALPSGFLGRFVDEVAESLSAMVRDGREPVLLTRASLRPFLAEAVTSVIPNSAVLSYQETAPARRVETTNTIAVASA
ncbi:MAG: flagellar biosynthesis protein FlhA [Planctomycetes bacterium]|nr:flagellar biosynthesis protein FlhA [Planctomycetota bacterium]